MKPHLTIRAVQPVIAALQALGYETKALLAEVGIPWSVLKNPDGRIPNHTVMLLWKHMLAATRDDQLGIHLAEAAPIQSFEVHAYAMLSSPTLRDAYRRACRYQRLIHEVNDLTLEEGPQEGVLQHTLPGGRSVSRHPAEFLVTLWVRFGRIVTGEDWSPRLVCFAHDTPGNVSEHTRVFQCPVLFASGRTAMHVPNSLLDAPNPKADMGLLRVLDHYAHTLLNQVPWQATFSERVRVWLLEELKDGAPKASSVAEAMHMSVRSLHRELRGEGTSFGELLESLRHQRATAMLADSRYSISEVAFLLGFSELSSFYRAFRRWTGKTPAEFRAEAFALRLADSDN